MPHCLANDAPAVTAKDTDVFQPPFLDKRQLLLESCRSDTICQCGVVNDGLEVGVALNHVALKWEANWCGCAVVKVSR